MEEIKRLSVALARDPDQRGAMIIWLGMQTGRLLRHTQIGTTQRHSHLIDSPLRAGVNAVGEMLKPRLKVVGG